MFKALHLSCLCMFAGNKNDKTNSREIPLHIGEEFSRRHEMRFLETSAKEADNVDKLFLEIAKELTQLARQNDLRPSFGTSSTDFVDGGSTPVSSFNVGSCCKMA